jgi:hypothetical protein
MGPAASSYNHPLSPPNMNNIRMSASQNPGVSNTLGVSGTATGIINAQASHPGVNSGATMETIFGTMTAMTIVISTFFSL